MIRRLLVLAALGAVVPGPRCAWAQGGPAPVPDSIAVEGHRRVARETILLTSGLLVGQALSYRELQRGIQALYASGQFDDVRVGMRQVGQRQVLVVRVRERPLLVRWSLRGVTRLPEGAVRDKVALVEGRPLDPAALQRSRARIDSLYRARGYYLAGVVARTMPDGADSGRVRVVLDITEGRRVAIARVQIEGNTHFADAEIVDRMESKPEGFWWFRTGRYDDERLVADLQERLPAFYGGGGYVDFQVLGDTLIVDESSGKATLVVRVSEGDPYRVGTFEIVGSRRFSTDDLARAYPFDETVRTGVLGLGGRREVAYFDQKAWDDATQQVQRLYFNNGYISAQVRGDVLRRSDAQGRPVVDLRWVITEGQPAVIRRVEIAGNDVTHDRVIREQIVVLPGDLFRQDALLRSYQNISNLGFFNQPLPFPDIRPASEDGDVDVVFRVTEKRTGNINFGASIGQGTGLGGFLGLDEPNLFGLGKRGKFQWQFGRNINDFDVSYTDPGIRGSRISGTIGVHNTRLRYRIGNLGRVRRRGASLQLGFPLFRDRYTRLFVSYGVEQQTVSGSSENVGFTQTFRCTDCVRSTLGSSVLRDTRIDLPFATAGTMTTVSLSQSGGPLGGRGNFQRAELEGRWYAPLGELQAGTGAPLKLVLGLSVRSGFVFGESPFFEQLFFMGGTQYGIPLRGYDEFSITTIGFDPRASTGGASGEHAFGKAYYAMTAEAGLRISQMLYVSAFMDAGNLWSRAGQFNPTRLFRGAGVGAAIISPLGPLGLDLAHGFDRTDEAGRPAPGWKLHFKLGNMF